ncbi:5319_t:CDS:2, partial [Acaulospora colombiana]
TWVYDLDTTLPFPCDIETYIREALIPADAPQYHRYSKESFVEEFNTVDAEIILYDSSNNELTSFSNADFPFSFYSNSDLNYYKSDTIIEGKLEIAQFEQQDATSVSGKIDDAGSSPCTLKPISVGMALLIIPFDKAQELGCDSIDELISRNTWITQDMTPSINNQTGLLDGTTILPNGTYSIPVNNTADVKKRMASSTPSPLIACDCAHPLDCKDQCGELVRKTFESRNSGIVQQLMRRDDPIPSSGIPQVVVFTSTNGGDPGIKEPLDNQGKIQNAKVGLTLLRKDDVAKLMNLSNVTSKVSVTSGNVSGAWLSATKYSVITGVVFLLLCTFYVGLQYSWYEFLSLVHQFLSRTHHTCILSIILLRRIKASIEVTKFDVNLSPIVRLAAELQRYILVFGICLIVVAFFFNLMAKTTQSSHFSTVLSIVNKSLFIALVDLGYLTFGMFMIYDLATNREINQKIGETLTFKFSSKADKKRALQLTDDLSKSISMISILLLLRSHHFASFLSNPVSLSTNRPLNRSLHPTPEQIEEDERRNSAAYTTRMAVVKPEPTYRMNPNRLSVGYYNNNLIRGGLRGNGYLGGVREKGGKRGGATMDNLGANSGKLGDDDKNDRNSKGDGIGGSVGEISENPSSLKDYIKLSESKSTNCGKSEISKFDIIDL